MRPSIISMVRDLAPTRPLTRVEAMSIAERQAQSLLRLLAVDRAPVDERRLLSLPRLELRRHSPWPSSGATQWINGRWVVVLNASEPAVRQRFSLAHELKHIIDHDRRDITYDHIPADQRHAFIESVCDYFAGCLLMPRPWVKQAYVEGTQRLDLLARRFHVSQAAMSTRLAQLGLTDPTPRCARPSRDWAVRAIETAGGDFLYQRNRTRLLESTPIDHPLALEQP